jgi:hypothetical protein
MRFASQITLPLRGEGQRVSFDIMRESFSATC